MTDIHFEKIPKGMDKRVAHLKQIPGIGAELGKSLLTHFDNIETINNATLEELMEVEKVGKTKAQNMIDFREATYEIT